MPLGLAVPQSTGCTSKYSSEGFEGSEGHEKGTSKKLLQKRT